MTIFLFTIMVVLKNKSISLRREAELLHVINVYLIRSCFWVIFLVGLVDITIAFFRVEKIFEVFFTKEFSSNFTRPNYYGNSIQRKGYDLKIPIQKCILVKNVEKN